jgi:hypothetical protein
MENDGEGPGALSFSNSSKIFFTVIIFHNKVDGFTFLFLPRDFSWCAVEHTLLSDKKNLIYASNNESRTWARSSARIEHRAFNQRSVDWSSFREFVASSCAKGYTKDKIRYAKQFADCLFKEDFSQLQRLSESKRNHVMCALSSLAKFLGKYEDFKRLIGAYGLKWKSVNAEDLLISRINKVERDGSVLNWIREVKEKRPELNDFMDFMLVTGLRYVEAIESYNLIIKLAKEG